MVMTEFFKKNIFEAIGAGTLRPLAKPGKPVLKRRIYLKNDDALYQLRAKIDLPKQDENKNRFRKPFQKNTFHNCKNSINCVFSRFSRKTKTKTFKVKQRFLVSKTFRGKSRQCAMTVLKTRRECKA